MKRILKLLETIKRNRMEARRYPIYRIFERAIRVSFWSGLTIFVTNYVGVNIPLKVAFIAGVSGALDKFRNEYRKMFAEYNLSKWESITSLFEKD